VGQDNAVSSSSIKGSFFSSAVSPDSGESAEKLQASMEQVSTLCPNKKHPTFFAVTPAVIAGF